MKLAIGWAAVMLCVSGMASGDVAAGNSSQAPLTIGVCHLVNSLGVADRDDPTSPIYSINPAASASRYILRTENRFIDYNKEVAVTVIQEPVHGALKVDGGAYFRYAPANIYVGTDNATFLVEIGGLKIRVIYQFKVIDGGAGGGNDAYDPYRDKTNCPNGNMWKISTSFDANAIRGQVLPFAIAAAHTP